MSNPELPPLATGPAPGPAPGHERRRCERVVVNDEFFGVPKTPHVRDLSTRGVFVQTLERLPLGREVLLRFTVLLEDPVLLEAKGRVVRHQRQPSGMGIEFTELTPEVILRLNDAVTMARPLLLGAPVEDRVHEDTAPRAVVPTSPNVAAGSRDAQAAEDDPDAKTVVKARPGSASAFSEALTRGEDEA